MKVTIDPNTSPITPGAIASKNFSFSSGGGLPVTVVNSSGVLSSGGLVSGSFPVVPASEVTLFEGPVLALTGGKNALVISNFSVVGTNVSYKLKYWFNGVVVMTAQMGSVGNVLWSFLNTLTPAGLLTLKISVENVGGNSFTVGPDMTYSVLEFQ